MADVEVLTDCYLNATADPPPLLTDSNCWVALHVDAILSGGPTATWKPLGTKISLPYPLTADEVRTEIARQLQVPHMESNQ